MNEHTAIRIAKRDIDQVMEALNHTLGGDDPDLILDCLEGETDLFGIVRRLLDQNEHDEGNVRSLDQQIDDRKSRKDRAKHRIERRKAAIASLMDCARLTKLALPEATLSLRTLPPKPKVTDADALPDAFVTIQQVRKPDLEAIAVAIEGGASIPGAIRTNGSSSLAIRRK